MPTKPPDDERLSAARLIIILLREHQRMVPTSKGTAGRPPTWTKGPSVSVGTRSEVRAAMIFLPFGLCAIAELMETQWPRADALAGL